MKKLLVAFSAFMLLLGLSGAADAYIIDYSTVIVGTQYTSPYAGLPGFYTEDFTGSLIWTWTGDGKVVTGSSPGVYAAPMGSGSVADASDYVTVPIDVAQPITNIYSAALGGNYNYIGLWWGSVDTYNVLRFYKSGVLVATITGSDAISPTAANGNQTAPSTNLYVNISDLPYFDTFTMTSDQYAFEADNITVGVPEPTTLLMLGFGLLGLAGIRRKR